MLKAIRWPDYWLWVGVICGLYYLIILFLFYKTPIIHIFRSRLAFSVSGGKDNDLTKEDQGLFPQVHLLMDRIRLTIDQYPQNEQAFMDALKMEIGHFPQLKNTAFRRAINNRISTTVKAQYGMHFSEEVLEGLWGDQ